MGYHIAYQSEDKASSQKTRCIRMPLLTLVFFVIFLLLVANLWPDSVLILSDRILMKQQSIAVSALNVFADEINSGKNLFIAFSGFLRNLFG